MYTATPVICGLWGVPFLMLSMHLSKAIAANYISLVLFGWALAGPFWGIYSNRIGKRKPPLYIWLRRRFDRYVTYYFWFFTK